jgi:hypothetical protein
MTPTSAPLHALGDLEVIHFNVRLFGVRLRIGILSFFTHIILFLFGSHAFGNPFVHSPPFLDQYSDDDLRGLTQGCSFFPKEKNGPYCKKNASRGTKRTPAATPRRSNLARSLRRERRYDLFEARIAAQRIPSGAKAQIAIRQVAWDF